jgi:hypothetical protein
MSTVSLTSPIRNGAGPLAISAEPASLAELVGREAMAYREHNTAEGNFLACQLDRLAQLIRFVGASTPNEFDERIEVLEADVREQWFRNGYEDGMEAGCRQARRQD